jgi:hypothetical protein
MFLALSITGNHTGKLFFHQTRPQKSLMCLNAPTYEPDGIELSNEDRMQLALRYARNLELSGERPVVRRIASMYGVRRSTFRDRYIVGRVSNQEAREERQLLSREQEKVLVAWIIHWGYRGIPMNAHMIRAKAMILAGRSVGVNWIYRFQARNPGVKPVLAKQVAASRAKQINRTIVQDFYDQLFAELEKHGIPPQNIWNADEKGVICGDDSKVKVFISRKQKSAIKINQTDRDTTTILECICPTGVSIRPMFIFKGVRQSALWCSENDRGLHPA